MSKLGHWLRTEGITYEAFGESIEKSKSTVSRIVAGQLPVDRETAHAIFRVTGGAITPNDLYGIVLVESCGDVPARQTGVR